MKIANREINTQKKPLIIAEIGINHAGDLNVAKGMIKMIKEAGGEIVKHQTHFVEDEMTEEAQHIFPPNADKSIWDVMQESALSRDDEIALKSYAESLGLIYISTPFSRTAADFLNDIGVPAFKIGSGECDNLPLIRHIASFGKPIIMSTGMQNIETITGSVEILDNSGVDYALLECTNLYPSPPNIVSLRGITQLYEAFGDRAVIGFSDHSIGPWMCLGAVALGAAILERHFTDTRYRQGPDISCSMDGPELSFLIDRAEEIRIAANNPKQRTGPEEDVYRFARSSIVADRPLPAGHVITPEDIWARRPGSGPIPGYEFDKVVGKKVKTAKFRNQQLDWTDFE